MLILQDFVLRMKKINIKTNEGDTSLVYANGESKKLK